MQKAPQSVLINQQVKNEAIRIYENLVEDNFNDQIDNNALVAKLQVVGNELIEAIYVLNSTPKFGIVLQMDHEGISLVVEIPGNEFEKLSVLFIDEKSSDISIKLNLIADEIQINKADHTLRFVFESNSLYRELSNSRIITLKKYLKPEQSIKMKTHDSF